MEKPVLQVKELTKRVSGMKKIVDDVSFEVNKGEIVGLLGPNGAGKTTIIRMIGGLINKTNGSVIINGQDADRDPEACREEIGAIVENPSFYDFMSGYKNLQQYARLSRETITKERIDEVVALVKLENAIKDKVRKYSLGMKQRLGVAQAILHKPSLLILDEPTNGLDPKGIRELRDYLREMANEGTAVLVSSHLLSEMQLMCDRFIVVEHGKLIDSTVLSDQSVEEVSTHVSIQISQEQQKLAVAAIEELEVAELVRAEKAMLTVSLPYDSIPKLNEFLVGKGVRIFGLQSQKESLEDRFLALTAEKTAGGSAQ
ncbi:ABC transporter ATP-binding protein [Paenalkalicoccus suaedae]|uniref:ABC transporter ATP-binding protein n=1 Tax=Paenalkalicoccus suaedae TaxID=2592382 RepID=A0A859FD03_9BACI|nr:ABC transporter ATP-binding protein [Paenalkalicoccus suaedae]QKS70454.1 ABC transporter ATP-binding protein [Paenalkalicoccus suaedae]